MLAPLFTTIAISRRCNKEIAETVNSIKVPLKALLLLQSKYTSKSIRTYSSKCVCVFECLNDSMCKKAKMKFNSCLRFDGAEKTYEFATECVFVCFQMHCIGEQLNGWPGKRMWLTSSHGFQVCTHTNTEKSHDQFCIVICTDHSIS